MKKALSTILGILAFMAMEFLLLVMLVDPDWFRNVLVIIGVILLGLLFATVLVITSYVFGRDIERTKADSYIKLLREKHTSELERLNTQYKSETDCLHARYKEKISHLKSQHTNHINALNRQHSKTVDDLNEQITQMSVQMTDLGSQMSHNLEHLESLEGSQD